MTNSVDAFIDLTKLGIKAINNGLQFLFNIVYCNSLPPEIVPYFTDTYLFCFFEDPDDDSKLQPIGVPSARRRILAGHIARCFRHRFATHLLPYNWAVGVHSGMDFAIKAMQLSVEKFIMLPQAAKKAPKCAAVFLDLKNMFNLV